MGLKLITLSGATDPGGSWVDPGNIPPPGKIPLLGNPPIWPGWLNPATCEVGTKDPVCPIPGVNWDATLSGPRLLLPTPPGKEFPPKELPPKELPPKELPNWPGELLNCLPKVLVTDRVTVALEGERRPGSMASTSLILSTLNGLVVVVDLLPTGSSFGLSPSARLQHDSAIKARITELSLIHLRKIKWNN